MMKFGTDGIRGVPGKDYTLADLVKLGSAAAQVAAKKRLGRSLIGMDTRTSSPSLALSFAAGALAQGWKVLLAGVLPTPAVSLLCKKWRIPLGVMVSASHNPPEDNGIKLFQENGKKWEVDKEKQVELLMAKELLKTTPRSGIFEERQQEALNAYLEHLMRSFASLTFSSPIVLDCAYGAVAAVVRPLIEKIGLNAYMIHAQQKGEKINLGCGALHPEKLSQTVRRKRAALGFAFDGDGDRVVVCDEKGNIFDGDRILALFAVYFHQKRKLTKREIVVTVMSNQGLIRFLGKLGIKVSRTPVGDRFVLDTLQKKGLFLGGEQAGHIIFPKVNCSSDGLYTALQLISILDEMKTPLSHWKEIFEPFPQKTKSFRVDHKDRLMEHPELKKLMAKARQEVGRFGRVLLRPSGTEPKIRVMVEAESEDVIQRILTEFEDFFCGL